MGNQSSSSFWFFSGYSVIWELWRKRVPQLARAHPCQTTCSSGRDAFSDQPTPHSKMGHSSSSFSSARSTPSIPHRSGHYINVCFWNEGMICLEDKSVITVIKFLYFVPSSSCLVLIFPAWISVLTNCPSKALHFELCCFWIYSQNRHSRSRIWCALLFAEVPGHLKTSEAYLGV